MQRTEGFRARICASVALAPGLGFAWAKTRMLVGMAKSKMLVKHVKRVAVSDTQRIVLQAQARLQPSRANSVTARANSFCDTAAIPCKQLL